MAPVHSDASGSEGGQNYISYDIENFIGRNKYESVALESSFRMIYFLLIFDDLVNPSCFSSTFALCKSTSYESIILTLHWLNPDQIMSSLDNHRRKRIKITAGKQCDWNANTFSLRYVLLYGQIQGRSSFLTPKSERYDFVTP